MGPDYPATQKELCDYSRLFLDRAAGYAPKDSTVVRALRQLVSSGFVATRAPQPKTILYWMASGRVDPLFPAYDRDAYAAWRRRDPFPVFAPDGRAFLVARRSTKLPNVVRVHLRKTHFGAFTWWRACHHARALLGRRFEDELDRACSLAVRSAQQAVLGFLWACHEGRETDARAARVADDFGASRERRTVRPEHEFGSICPSGDCSIGRAAQRALEILDSRYASVTGVRGLRPIYRDLDRRILERASHHERRTSGRKNGSEHAHSTAFRRTIETLKATKGPAADVFQQWERAWSTNLVDTGRRAAGRPPSKPTKPNHAVSGEARDRCVLMVRKDGYDPAEAARDTGASVSKVAQWLEEFDRVALVAPHVEPGKIARATGLARPSSRAYLALWTEIVPP